MKLTKYIKGDTVFYMGKKATILDVDFDEHKPHDTTYKIKIYQPFDMVFWVHNKEIDINTITP